MKLSNCSQQSLAKCAVVTLYNPKGAVKIINSSAYFLDDLGVDQREGILDVITLLSNTELTTPQERCEFIQVEVLNNPSLDGLAKEISSIFKWALQSKKQPREVLTIDNCIAYLFKNADSLSFEHIMKLDCIKHKHLNK